MRNQPQPTQPRSSIDDILDIYKRDVDMTLLRENLKLAPDERSRKFEDFMASLEELRGAAQEGRTEENRLRKKNAMALETVVALQVDDPDGYQKYRDGMMPILKRHGGSFGYDFEIAKVLKSESDHPINRVFTIRFPDQATHDAFFAHEDYLKVRKAHFEPSVSAHTSIATYERE